MAKYKYVDLTEEQITAAVIAQPLKLIPNTDDNGARLRFPQERAKYDAAVAALLTQYEGANAEQAQFPHDDWLDSTEEVEQLMAENANLREELAKARAQAAKGGASRLDGKLHGIFDLRKDEERRVYSQGSLDKVTGRQAIDKQVTMGRAVKPWGHYPDLTDE